MPGLSIVIAARDEAQSLKESLTSLLEQDYPDLEILLVNDRSTDATQDIANEIKAKHPLSDRLTIIHNQELPQGWLGKVHALYLGAKASQNPLILFTDADIKFGADALRRAVSAQKILRADHLAIAPEFEVRGFWEPVLVAYFFVLFVFKFQPWRVHLKKDLFVGVGAFNLVTRATLQRLEFLEPLRLQVVDDMHLGRMVKSRGGRQFSLLGRGHLKVRWFEGLLGVVKGLEKNAYAGLNYHFGTAMAAGFFAAFPFWWLLGLLAFKATGWFVAFYAFQVVLGSVMAHAGGVPRWVGFAFPFAGLVLAYTILRSAILAETRKAVIWRQTSYPLSTLRQAHHDFVAHEVL